MTPMYAPLIQCRIKWFHVDCLGMKVLPENNEKWFCKECIEKTANEMVRKKKVNYEELIK